jgi:hypothetical protein
VNVISLIGVNDIVPCAAALLMAAHRSRADKIVAARLQNLPVCFMFKEKFEKVYYLENK